MTLKQFIFFFIGFSSSVVSGQVSTKPNADLPSGSENAKLSEMRRRLNQEGVGPGKFELMKNVSAKPDEFTAVFSESYKYLKGTFPPGSTVTYYKCPNDVKPVLYFRGEKKVFPFRGAKCAQISARSELVVECTLSEDLSFRKSTIPIGTEVLFKVTPDDGDPVSVAYISKLSKDAYIDGKFFKKESDIKVGGRKLEKIYEGIRDVKFRCVEEA